jgi:hypothetical protein
VTHQPLAAVVSQIVGMAAEQGRNLGFDGLRQQRAAPLRKTSVSGSAEVPGWQSWNTLISVTAYHSLGWRSGGVEHPHDTPPNPSCRHQLSPIAHVLCLDPPMRAPSECTSHVVGRSFYQCGCVFGLRLT